VAKQAKHYALWWGDDIGTWNVPYFSRGMMGYRTPNIDRDTSEKRKPEVAAQQFESQLRELACPKRRIELHGSNRCRRVLSLCLRTGPNRWRVARCSQNWN
jgi:hypothetical protein